MVPLGSFGLLRVPLGLDSIEGSRLGFPIWDSMSDSDETLFGVHAPVLCFTRQSQYVVPSRSSGRPCQLRVVVRIVVVVSIYVALTIILSILFLLLLPDSY